MQAAFITGYGGPEVLQFGELEEPAVSDGKVKVRIRFSALNHLDLWVRKGLPHLKLSFPHILGGDGAGEVVEIGKGVTRFAVGDKVIVHPGITSQRPSARVESLNRDYQILGEHLNGLNAQFAVIPEENCFPIPPSIRLEEAASIGLVYTTAWQMVRVNGQVSKGQTVLVHSAGSGVGSAAIQIAKDAGAKVITTASSEEKRNHGKDLGADYAFPYEGFSKAIKQVAPGGVDLIIDHLGAKYWGENLRTLGWGGTLVLCGATTGPMGDTDLRHVFFRQLRILGSTMGNKSDFPDILEGFSQRRFRPTVDKTFPLKEIADAHRYLEERRQFGKVLLSVDS